ncbi:MAG: transporter permease, partial [Rhizobacter sp.]|nr:transporter permease [Rhizobacter sp.]
MRLEKRDSVSRPLRLAAPFVALLFALLVMSALLAWADAPIDRAWALLVGGGFGSASAWAQTLTRATPLILTGLSAAVALRAGLFNFGVQGQLALGALAAVAVGGLHGGVGFDVSPWLLFPAMVLAAAVAGAALLLGPALLMNRLGVDEALTTLLLNFVVLLFVSLMLDGALADRSAVGGLQSVALQDDLLLGRLVEGGPLHTGLLWAWALALLTWALMRFTTTGIEIRSLGANGRAARFAGMPIGWITVKVAVLSGALACLAGAIEVAGLACRLTLDTAPGYVWIGIAIAV